MQNRPAVTCLAQTEISLYGSAQYSSGSNASCPHTSCKVHWCWRRYFRKCVILGKLYQLCHLNNKYRCWARGSVVGWGAVLQAGRSLVRVPDEVDFFNLPNFSCRTMTLGSTQPLTEMNTRNLPGVKSGRRVGLTTLPPSVSRMSENVWASTSRNPKGLHGLYRDNFTFGSRDSSVGIATGYGLDDQGGGRVRVPVG
jgi:hypothetical protein